MSKPKNTADKRPSPPDRDGDGHPGGSLPGNQTVDAAKGPEAEATDPQIPERDMRILDLLELAGLGGAFRGLLRHDVAAWADTEAEEVKAFLQGLADQTLYLSDTDASAQPPALAAALGGLPPAVEVAVVTRWSPDVSDEQMMAMVEKLAERSWPTTPFTSAMRHGDAIAWPVRTVEAGKGPETTDLPATPQPQAGSASPAGEAAATTDNQSVATASGAVAATALATETAPAAAAVQAFVEVVINPRDEGDPLTFGVRTNIPGLVIETDTLAEAMQESHRCAEELMRDAGREGDEILFTVSPEAKEAEAAELGENAGAEPDDTFTPEEIAAGQTDLVQEEGESAIAAAMAAPLIPDTDPLVTIETATAPVALRLGNLRRLVDNRLFYKTAEGFSPNYHAPHVEEAEVRAWIDNGLARWDETAGRSGGVYAEPEAGRVLRGQAQQAVA